jgi:outer membrane protein assembly factor BamB
MKRLFAVAWLCVLAGEAAAFPGGEAGPREWTRFRGPNGTGVLEVGGLPVEFGRERGAEFRAEVPFGRSSPVLAGSAVFLTAQEGDELLTFAVDRASGELLWSRALPRARADDMYQGNNSASPTPVTDGEKVWAFFQEFGLVCYDLEGDEVWTRELGPFNSFYGIAASPVLAGDAVILACDQQSGSFVIAVDRNTGEERWRRERPDCFDSWATPVLAPADPGPEELVLLSSFHADGLEPSTGESLWRVPGLGPSPVTSPVLAGDRLLVNAPYGAAHPIPSFEDLLAMADADQDGALAREETAASELGDHFGWVDVDKDGRIVAAEWNGARDRMSSQDYGCVALDLAALRAGADHVELWRHKKSLPDIATPLVYRGLVVLAKDGGIVTVLDLDSGEEQGRFRLPDAPGPCYASPVAGDGKIYVCTESGKIAVLEAGPGFEVLAVNDLGEEIHATPALAADGVFVRTAEALYRFSGSPGR